MQVVSEREAKYRSPLERSAGWREGPTVYGFGYLWTVHSLYYWWRDQVRRELGRERGRDGGLRRVGGCTMVCLPFARPSC